MYVEQPKGYMVKGSEHMVYKPHNALYELGLAALNLTSSVKDSKKVKISKHSLSNGVRKVRF